jgi:geranylgeranyl diphosphate synthase, type II
MIKLTLDSQYSKYLTMVNGALEETFKDISKEREIIADAMRYSLLAGGKRIRPVLVLAVCDLFSYDLKEALPFAVAIEMIHTYSLIHDDLPAMDNDDLRRGKPTNHKVFGEGIAILAGDGLLNSAFELMAGSLLADPQHAFHKGKALHIVAKASGVEGMIGGQVIDLESEGVLVSEDLLRKMHALKTGALLKAPVMVGAELSEASQEEKEALETYAAKIGLAFQIKDDILDVEGDTIILGKPVGSDGENNKSTFVSLLGLEKSKELLRNITKEAVDSLAVFGERALFLKLLAEKLANRDD